MILFLINILEEREEFVAVVFIHIFEGIEQLVLNLLSHNFGVEPSVLWRIISFESGNKFRLKLETSIRIRAEFCGRG